MQSFSFFETSKLSYKITEPILLFFDIIKPDPPNKQPTSKISPFLSLRSVDSFHNVYDRVSSNNVKFLIKL